MRILYSSLGKFNTLAKQFRKLANHELQVRYNISLAEARKHLTRISGYQSDYEIKQSLVKPGSATLLPHIDIDNQDELLDRARESLPSLNDSQLKSILRRIFGAVTHRLMIAPSACFSLVGQKGYLRRHCPNEFAVSLDGRKSPITDKNIIHFVIGDVDANLNYVESHPAYKCPSIYEFLLRAWSDREGDLFSGLPRKLLIHRNLEQYFDDNIYNLLADLDIGLEVSGPNSRKGVRLCSDLDKNIDHEVDMGFTDRKLEENYDFIKAYTAPDLFIAANLASTISKARMAYQRFHQDFPAAVFKSVKPLLGSSETGNKLNRYIAELPQANSRPLNELLDIKNIPFIENDVYAGQIVAAQARANEWRLYFSPAIELLRDEFEDEMSDGFFLLYPALEKMREHRGFIHPAIQISDPSWCRTQAVDAIINSLPKEFIFGEDRLPYSAGTDWSVYQVFWLFIESLLKGNGKKLVVTSKSDVETEYRRYRLQLLEMAIYFLILLYLLDPEEFFDWHEYGLDLDFGPLVDFIGRTAIELPSFSVMEAKEVMANLDCDFDNVTPDYGSLESIVDKCANHCLDNYILTIYGEDSPFGSKTKTVSVLPGNNSKQIH